jgi:dipeptidyl aminopeptidase/acylaminoacyl peptidase
MKMLVRLAVVACVLVGVAGAQETVSAGTAKRPMTFADLQIMKRVSEPQISPSGKWVMFSVTDVSLEKNSRTNHLWVVPLTGGKETQITSGDGESNGRFSPDGRLISLTMKDQIFEMPWNEAKGTVGKAIQVTNVDGGADGAIWSPDSKRLMFVGSVYPECSDLGDWAKEDACDKAKNEAADKSPVKAMIFDHLLYRHWNAFTGEKRSHVLLVDSADGRGLRDLTPRSAVGDAETPTFSLGGPLGYAWAPDTKEIAYVTNLEKVKAASTNNDVFTLRLDEAGAVAKKVSTSPGSDDGPAYSPDGHWLAWRSQARNGFESDKFGLVRYNRLTPEHETENFLTKFDGWVDEFIWGKDDGEIFFASGDRGEESIYSLGLGREDYGKVVKYQAPGEFSDVRPISFDSLVATRMFVDKPSEIVSLRMVYDGHTLEKKSDRRDVSNAYKVSVDTIADLNQRELGQLSLAPLEPFWFEGAAGTKVEGFIVKPPNFDPAKKYPVKFLMHGGPQTAWGDAWSYRWNWELLAADGYVVIGVNRRGSTGYGQKFVDEVSGDWGGKAFVDLMKGLDYAEAKYTFIDKDRECALGASYGGFMANWVLTHTDRFKCIVTHDGLYNAESAFGTTEELWFNEWEFRPIQTAAAGTQIPYGDDNKKGKSDEVEQGKPAYPWDYFDKPTAENPFRKNSPMLYIKNAHTPTLVVHSQKDYRLDVSEGFQLFTALQLRGVPSKMLYFPDEGHWVLKPQNSQLWYETVDDWCDRWLGMGKYKDAGPEKNPMAKAAHSTH